MGIKNWVGKSLLKLLQETKQRSDVQEKESISAMERMFGSANPAVVAFKIENGFVVRTMDEHTAIMGGRVGGFTYCKDHQAIADHLITSNAVRKLVGAQREMFGESIAGQAAESQAYTSNHVRKQVNVISRA